MDNILILGGTEQAREIAQEYLNLGHKVIMSIAGRTLEGEKREKIANPKVKVRVGGFNGADGLAKWIVDKQINLIVDATHPFARQISENVRVAAKNTGVELIVHNREPWEKTQKDQWNVVKDVEAAIEAVEACGEYSIVFLALGHQYIDEFQKCKNTKFIIRQVDQPAIKFKGECEYVIGQPSQKVKEEIELFQKYKVNCLVCRNSGGTRSYTKIVAAQELKLPVIMIDRPK